MARDSRWRGLFLTLQRCGTLTVFNQVRQVRDTSKPLHTLDNYCTWFSGITFLNKNKLKKVKLQKLGLGLAELMVRFPIFSDRKKINSWLLRDKAVGKPKEVT